MVPLSPSSSLPLESSSRSTVQAREASIGCERKETRRTTPASYGNSHRRPSRGEGACRRRGSGVMPCVVDWMLWSGVVVYVVVSWFPTTPYATSVLYSLEAHQPYLIFSLHSFSFTLTILIFFIQTQNFENKRISIEVFEILRI